MADKTDLKIVNVPIAELIPAEYNPRKANKKQCDELKKSITKFGMVDPIIVNCNRKRANIIIGGHFRCKMAAELGFKTVPVVYIDIADVEKEKELNIRLNKNTGEFDFDLLANFDQELLVDVGFDSIQLDKIFTGEPEPEEDKIPEVNKTNIKIGDMFQLGKHRLFCGDCTVESNVKKLMGNELADMVFTDPPYAVNYGNDQDLLNKKSHGKFRAISRPIKGDNLTAEQCAEKIWRPSFKNLYLIAAEHCSFYMTMCQGGDQMMMMMMMMSENWKIKHELIWVKSSPVFSMGRLDYDYKHEPILFGWKNKHNFYGSGKFANSIWEIPKPHKSELHPTMKPVELIENAILNSSKRGEIVVDIFGGSGSTLIACEKTNRQCRMMELEEHYCQVIIDRWELFTGQKAVKLK